MLTSTGFTRCQNAARGVLSKKYPEAAEVLDKNNLFYSFFFLYHSRNAGKANGRTALGVIWLLKAFYLRNEVTLFRYPHVRSQMTSVHVFVTYKIFCVYVGLSSYAYLRGLFPYSDVHILHSPWKPNTSLYSLLPTGFSPWRDICHWWCSTCFASRHLKYGCPYQTFIM